MRSEMIYRIAGEIIIILAVAMALLGNQYVATWLIVFAVWCHERADYHKLLNGIKNIVSQRW